MTYFEIGITFILAWWLAFFMALPFGARPDDAPVPGSVESAPARPRLWIKAGVAVVLAALVTWGVDWLVQSGLVQLRP